MSEIMKMSAVQTMSSREIADLTKSSHDNMLKTIRGLVAEGVVFGNETPYKHPQNGQYYVEFKLDYRNTMVVISGFNAKLRAKIIDRWQELEAAQAPKLPTTYLDALKALVASTEAQQRLESENATLKPKALIADTIHDADGLHSMSEAAKIIGTGRTRLFEWMRTNHIIDRHNMPLQKYIDSGHFRVKERPYTRGDAQEIYAQVFVTGKGITWLTAKYIRG